jgi:glycosyltransferase involved in cell wall biosynthesis
VVIPTRDRAGSLARCLRALELQTAGPGEVIVVDDGSRDPEAVRAAAAARARVRIVRTSGIGPAAARNAGARAASAPYVCFTDDDCEPAAEWIARLVSALERGADVVAGPTLNARPGDPLATASQTVCDHLAEATFDRSSGRIWFAPSSNLACRAELLAAVPFADRFPAAGGEDRDWCARLADAGHALAFEPAAAVAHHQELSLTRFWRQHVRYGSGAHRFRRGRRGQRRLEPTRFYVGLLRRGFGFGPAVGVLVCAAQLATGLGFAGEAIRARQRRRSDA